MLLKGLRIQQYLDEPRACTVTLGHRQTHTTVLAGKGKMIGLDSKCQPMGQISCVMMRNRLAVWGGVCVCVTHMGRSLAMPRVYCID